MSRYETIARAISDEVRAQLTNGGDRTDWPRVKSMPQAEIERLADEEDGPLSENWQDTITLGFPRRT